MSRRSSATRIGYLAIKIIRRIVGYAQIADFLTIEDVERRAEAQAGALALARALLKRPAGLSRHRRDRRRASAFEGAGPDPKRAPA